MENGTVSKRILVSNVCMVLVTLMLFLAINLLIIYCYGESIEDEVKATIEQTVGADRIDDMLASYTSYRNQVILLVGVDGILCILSLIIVSIFFTRNLTEHIMKPLDALSEGTKRIKANNLSEPIIYTGDKEFENVCASFNEMMSAVSSEQEKNRNYEKARTDMIAGISHDLRTPLTAIRGSLKALLDGVVTDSAQQKHFLETAYKRTGDMDMLLSQLFCVSKLETGNMPIESENIELADFLKTYVLSRQADLSDECEILNIDTHDSTATVSADAQHLLRILDNLLENSRKYAKASPLIVDISLQADADKCCICVKDNGEGVPDDRIALIFDEFYRVDESRNKNAGNGLGLYIVKCLTEAMGGSVHAVNSDGLAIYLEFPLVAGRDA